MRCTSIITAALPSPRPLPCNVHGPPSTAPQIADLPAPKDGNVKLVEVPATTYAAIRFRGTMTDAVAKEREGQLRVACAKESIALSADPAAVQWCAYNPPWTLPWLRTNDVLIPLEDLQ